MTLQEKIKAVQEGKLAIENDGTLEQLRGVLNTIAPYSRKGLNNFYYLIKGSDLWRWSLSTNLPTIKASTFFDEKFKTGDLVEVNNDEDDIMVYLYSIEETAFLCEESYHNKDITIVEVYGYPLDKLRHKKQNPTEITVEEALSIVSEHKGIPIEELRLKK